MSGPTGKSYTICWVQDLLKVPSERRQQCLDELAGWLRHVEIARLKLDPRIDLGPFIWTDDGAGGVRDDFSRVGEAWNESALR